MAVYELHMKNDVNRILFKNLLPGSEARVPVQNMMMLNATKCDWTFSTTIILFIRPQKRKPTKNSLDYKTLYT